MANRKVFHSLYAFGCAMGAKRKQNDDRSPTRKCFRCGGDMRWIEETNVFVCDGETKDKKPCGNMLILPIR